MNLSHLKSYWQGLSKRKIIGLSLIVLVLVSAGFLVTRQVFKADTDLQTITISGTSTNPSDDDKPVAGAKIIATNLNGQKQEVLTDENGEYSLEMTVDITDPADRRITVKQEDDILPNREGSTFSLSALDTNDLTQDFSLAPLPREIRDFIEYIRSNPTDEPAIICHNKGGAVRATIDGITFCSPWWDTNGYWNLQVIADQINFLQENTGYYNIGNLIYLDPLGMFSGVGGQYLGEGVILLDSAASAIMPRPIITHEFGHGVDLEGNAVIPRVRWSGLTFGSSYLCESAALIGYGARNDDELFAEIFTALWYTDPNKTGQFIKREKLRYLIENFLLFSPYEFNFGSSADWTDLNTDFGTTSIITGRGGLPAQNAWMYAYKYVAYYSNVDQYFPGQIGHPDYQDQSTMPTTDAIGILTKWVLLGNYMDVGVVSLALVDCQPRLIGGMKVKFAATTVQTRFKKDSGVFSDGSGDLFDITGTAVIFPVPTGPQPYDAYYYTTLSKSGTENVRTGSNAFKIEIPATNVLTNETCLASNTTVDTQGNQTTAKILLNMVGLARLQDCYKNRSFCYFGFYGSNEKYPGVWGFAFDFKLTTNLGINLPITRGAAVKKYDGRYFVNIPPGGVYSPMRGITLPMQVGPGSSGDMYRSFFSVDFTKVPYDPAKSITSATVEVFGEKAYGKEGNPSQKLTLTVIPYSDFLSSVINVLSGNIGKTIYDRIYSNPAGTAGCPKDCSK